MQVKLYATTASPPPLRTYGGHTKISWSQALPRGRGDTSAPTPGTWCIASRILQRAVLSALLVGVMILVGPAPSTAQQFMLVQYELSIECENLPGSSVTITAEAQDDLFGTSFTLLDPSDPVNTHYFSSSQSSQISNGANTSPLLWDFTDDNTPNAGRLMYGLYKFTGPGDTYFYINYLHCYSGSPDIRMRLRYTGSTYVFEWRDYSSSVWVDKTGDVLNLWDVTDETRDVSCFQVDVTLQNVYHLAGGGSTNQHGEIFVDDVNTSYPSPSTVAFDLESEHQSWPGETVTDAVQSGTMHKFHDWNGLLTNHDIIHTWFTDPELGSITANHNPTMSSTGKVLFDGIASAADVQLRDPWKVIWPVNDIPYSDRSFNTYNFSSGGFDFGDISLFGGVFLNKPPTSSAHSYFSIRTPEQLTWNGSGWDFLLPTAYPSPGEAKHWRNISAPSAFDISFTLPVNSSHVVSDQVTQDVEFLTQNTELNVEYKTHLVSDESVSYSEARGPLGANSQRKIGYLSSDGYIMVYESNGHVWLSHSEASPLAWGWELCLGSGQHPSLYTVEDSALVTWMDNGRIVAGKYHNGQFQAFESPTLASFKPDTEAFPVIASADDLDVIVFESDISTDLSYIILECDEFIAEGYIPGALGGGIRCVTPTMTADYGPYFDIAWRQDRDIASTRLTVRTWIMPVSVFIDVPQLLPRYNENYVGAPSITNYHYNAQPPNDIIRIIAAPSREPLGQAKINIFSMDATMVWANMQSFYSGYFSHDIWAPSLAGIDALPCGGAYDNVRCAFNVTDYTMYPTAYYTRAVGVNCGAWSITDPQVSSAIHPSVVAFPPATRGRGVHVDLQSANVPTPLASSCKQLGDTDIALNRSAVRRDLLSSRVLWLRIDTSALGIGLGRVELIGISNSTPVDWKDAAGPAPINTASAASAHLTTESFTAGSGTVLKYRLMKERGTAPTIPAGTTVYLELVDAGTSSVIAILESLDATALQSGRTVITTTRNIGQYSGQNLRLRLRPVATAPAVSFAIADYHNIDTTSSSAFPKADVEYIVDDASASVFGMRLEQNYPNPFNPTTTLTYFLPETRHATLVVYDAMGREVRRLVDGQVMAGEHRIEFDASGLASGTFIAKLSAGTHVITRRMTLIR